MTVRLEEGQLLADRFTLMRRLSGDLPGELWSAEDTLLREPALLRLLQPTENFTLHPQFTEAIEAAGALVHPALLRTYYHQPLDDGWLLIASEGTPGLNPVEWHPSQVNEQLRLLLPVLDVLDYAHHLGRAHGHLTRATILTDNSGQSYLSEFGAGPLVLAATDATQPILSAAPAATDDIHALGALLYEAVTGEKWRAERGEDLARLAALQLPRALANTITRMLSPAPYDRPASIGEVAQVLRDLIDSEAARFETVPRFDRAGLPTATAGTGSGPLPRVDAPISRRETQVMSVTTASALFLILALALGAVVLLLPAPFEAVTAREVHYDPPAPERNGSAAPEAKQAGDAGPAPFESAVAERLRRQADELATQLLRQQVYLEDSAVLLWAPEPFAEALAKGEEADTLFRDEQYEGALDRLREGSLILEGLERSVPQVLEQALRDSRDALATGERAAAERAFEIVRAIDPENPEAASGLMRAQTIEQAFALYRQAEARESTGDLEAALELTREILRIDPALRAAAEASKRISGKIRQRDFERAMTRALDALHDERFGAARGAFLAAQQLMPEAPAPQDGLDQVEQALRLREIQSHRTAAQQFEIEEAWSKAAAEYAAVLQLDGSLLFATDGKRYAEERAEIAGRVGRFLNDPELLADGNNYELARTLHAQASEVAEGGPRFTQQLTRLGELIRLARLPVDVEIRSDKLTDVTLYRVGKLGRIDATIVTLYPGTYRALGTRRGYRDQQLEFKVIPGQTPDVIVVRCTEKI